jgi:hypothetical protein
MKCPEAPEEESTSTMDSFDDLKCHITSVRGPASSPILTTRRILTVLAQNTNYMATGIKDVRARISTRQSRIRPSRPVAERHDRKDEPEPGADGRL